jgi:deoxyribose-phosphate aldolase
MDNPYEIGIEQNSHRSDYRIINPSNNHYICHKKKMQAYKTYSYSFSELTARVESILEIEKSKTDRLSAMKTILSIIDLTTLSGDDTHQKVKELCQTGINFKNDKLDIPQVAAICVYPVFVPTVKKELEGTGIRTASVAGAFPSGQSPLDIRVAEVDWAIEHGADDIDMVISRGRLLEGEYDDIFDEVQEIKGSCQDAHLKVILETGELKTVANIRKACELALMGGADFLKTSTGKIEPAATPEAFLIMLDTIKEFFELTKGTRIGIKPAGGISTPDEALTYYLLVKNVLGDAWLSKNLFRIGASQLAGNVYNEIIELTTT